MVDLDVAIGEGDCIGWSCHGEHEGIEGRYCGRDHQVERMNAQSYGLQSN